MRLLLPAVACCLSVSSLACCLSVGFSRPRPYGIFGRVVRRHSAMLRFYLSCCAILPFYSRPQLLTMWCPRPVCSRCRVCFRPRTHVARLSQSWVARSRRPSCPLAPPPCLTLNHPVSHAGCRSRPVICHRRRSPCWLPFRSLFSQQKERVQGEWACVGTCDREEERNDGMNRRG